VYLRPCGKLVLNIGQEKLCRISDIIGVPQVGIEGLLKRVLEMTEEYEESDGDS